MAKDDGPGCFSYLLGGVLGGVSGVVTAVLIGLMNAPVIHDEDSLEHEWYTPLVLFIMPLYGLIIGVMVGLFGRTAYEVSGGRAVAYGAAGLLLGLAVGKAVFFGRSDPSHIFVHSVLTCILTVVGLLFATVGAERSPRRTDEVKE